MNTLTPRVSNLLRLILLGLGFSLPLWSAPTAYAASIPVPNFSFEEDPTMGDNAGNSLITGWSANGDPKFAFAGTLDPGTEFKGAKGRNGAPKMHGYQVGFLGTRATLQSAAPLATIEAGVTYTLNVAIGDGSLEGQEPGKLQVGFLIGDQSPEDSSETLDGNDGTPEGTFADYTFSYTATPADAGKTLKILVRTLDESAMVLLDNFRLDSNR